MLYGSFRLLFWLSLSILCWSDPRLQASDVRLEPMSSEAPLVGDRVTWQAIAGEGSGPLSYQFSVAPPGGSFTILRDFTSNANWVAWAPLKDGWHTLRVAARDENGAVSIAEAEFEVASRLGEDQQPVVSPTVNPLVFLYSAPPCNSGLMIVQFRKAGGSSGWTNIPPRLCDGIKTENFFLAGLEPDTDYVVTHRAMTTDLDLSTDAAELNFHTGTLGSSLAPGTVLSNSTSGMDLRDGLLLESPIGLAGSAASAAPVARKLDGTVVWAYDPAATGKLANLLRPVEGGMLVVPSADIPGGLRLIDVSGNPIWETNPEAISYRLMELGYPGIGAFHHDALILPGGAILALADRNAEVPASTLGQPSRWVNGDVLLLLDQNFEVLWVWDSFEKLDVNRKAVLGESSRSQAGSGLPPLEDWTHGNSVEYLTDGNLLFSSRSQDWVIKIDFRDGTGTGDVLWRFGKDGDFKLESSDATNWFSHQHDAHFDGRRLWLFDNGNTRRQAWGGPFNSRGQVYLVDEQQRTARLEMNADLGTASDALGSAQRLSNGNYHFLSGMISDGTSRFSQSWEVSPSGPGGILRFGFEVPYVVYRTFRLHSLY